jgi:hypothetical protein
MASRHTYLGARRDIRGFARLRWVLTLRAQKADHYMLRVRIKRCARAHTRHRPGYRLYGGRGSQEFMEAV